MHLPLCQRSLDQLLLQDQGIQMRMEMAMYQQVLGMRLLLLTKARDLPDSRITTFTRLISLRAYQLIGRMQEVLRDRPNLLYSLSALDGETKATLHPAQLPSRTNRLKL